MLIWAKERRHPFIGSVSKYIELWATQNIQEKDRSSCQSIFLINAECNTYFGGGLKTKKKNKKLFLSFAAQWI